ncbi:ATPase family protein 2 homolog [Trichonephila clavata]|uniref:ATPase family protein 2 homolog n=1 Tax=Trichonephila clavata TaxID=2740835 RepID=A0A8X6GSF7_TRICU|nr:ATPase family protein 2 homolog [Trichonephila clavata]
MNTINPTRWKGDKNAFPSKGRHIVLISSSKFKGFKLKTGLPLLLTGVNGKFLLKYWSSESLEELSAALPAFSLFKHYTNSELSVEPFKGNVYEADKVTLFPSKYRIFMDSNTFMADLKQKLDQVYVKEGMILHLEYRGYPYCVTVQAIVSSTLDGKESKEQLESISPTSDSISLLEESFSEKCNIKTFKFQSSTPLSSPKIHLENKANNPQHLYFSSDINSTRNKCIKKEFYHINSKTKFIVKNLDIHHMNVSKKLQSRKLTYKMEDIFDLDEQVNDIRLSINRVLNRDSVPSSRGILIIGPSGIGKSILTEALQNEYEHQLSTFNVKKLILALSNGSAHFMKRICMEILNNTPSLVLIDDIDELCKYDYQQKKLSYIIYNILNSSADIVVIATCKNDASVPINLRKHGVLDAEIRLTVPSSISRQKILKNILKMYENDLSVDQMSEISHIAHGFTGGDLNQLCTEAILKKIEETSSDWRITFFDLQKSFKNVKPSSVMEFNFEVPNIKWNDIGGMDEVKNAVKEMVDWPLKYPEKLKKFKIIPPRGILMYGPPGCCKTMIAKALASESQLNFINIKSSQVFNMYVGESEKSISNLFKKARAAAPCILFFDEIDSLVPVRGSSNENSNVTDRVVTQILIEIDGIDVLQQGVCLIAATNRPDRIDPSLLRPGRLDRLIYVPLPDAHTRKQIFQVILQKKPISHDIDFQYLVDKTDNYTGAEISAICDEACMIALKEEISSSITVVNMKHFLTALTYVQPRTTQEMLEVFENYHKKFKS